ncbi:MAG TPA: acetyl-CoA decarbonylase/synthase complex subunit gamma [Dehalococcoidia bacterium]|nr:acetyl-CoA decarbonylase/synthase complex subunit gamma [Dehalococcoidia bacterium]
MAITGIEIFKMLPKTNCGECGVPTCLAFAMSLVAGKTELSKCPYLSEEARNKLEEASTPPIRPVTIGKGENAKTIGGETVMFRHEKRFENAPAIALLISDAMTEADIDKRIESFNTLVYDRVGQTLRAEMVALKCQSGNADKYKTLINKVMQKCRASIMLICENPTLLEAVLPLCADVRPLIYALTKENFDKIAALSKQYSCPVAVKGQNLDDIIELTTRLEKYEIKDIVIDSGVKDIAGTLEDQVAMRRAALNQKMRSLGYPTMVMVSEVADDPLQESLIAATFVAKYAGIIVLSDFSGETLFPLLVLRMNLFSDPQRPLATTEGIYEIGGPGDNSPVLLTCNFSLTYFIVSGEIESSRVPGYLLVKDTEGLSVMTAWAAGKFGADTIASFVKKCGITDKVKHRKLIIPGYIAIESGALEEELPDWEIIVGPREGAHIPAFLKTWKA